MGVEGIAVIAEIIFEIKDHAVSIGIGQRNIRRIFSGSLFGLPIDDGCNDSVRNRDGGLTEDGVALELLLRAGVNGATGIQLLPVHGKTLRNPHASIDGHRGPRVAGCVTAGIGGNISCSAQRWTDLHNGLAVNGYRSTGFAHVLVAWWGCAGQNRNAMRKLARRSSARGEDDVEKEQSVGALRKRSCGAAHARRLKSRGESGAVEGLENCTIAKDLYFLDRDISAREIGHCQFVDEVRATVRSVEGHWCVMHREQPRRHLFGGGGLRACRKWHARMASRLDAARARPGMCMWMCPF